MFYVCWFKYVRITDVVGASMNVIRNDDGITQSGGDEVRHVEQAPDLDASVSRPECGYTALRILPRRAAHPGARKKKLKSSPSLSGTDKTTFPPSHNNLFQNGKGSPYEEARPSGPA
jgi:hypothetical protein